MEGSLAALSDDELQSELNRRNQAAADAAAAAAPPEANTAATDTAQADTTATGTVATDTAAAADEEKHPLDRAKDALAVAKAQLDDAVTLIEAHLGL